MQVHKWLKQNEIWAFLLLEQGDGTPATSQHENDSIAIVLHDFADVFAKPTQLPQFDKLFTVDTDVCDEDIGVVLMQDERPIAYLSKALREKNRTLSIYDKEFLALMLVMEKWRQYLQHAEFIIRTDHRALSFLEDQRNLICKEKPWPN
jgi:hypothetical protein